MRLSNVVVSGVLLVLSFGLVSAQNKTGPGVQTEQGVTPPGVFESTYGPQPPEPTGSNVEKEAGENLYEFDERIIDSLKKVQLPVGVGGGSKILQALETRGGGAGIAAAPPLGTNFAGIDQSSAGGFFPADPIMAAGPNQVIVAVNLRFTIFSKTGTNQFTTSFGSFFSSINPSALNLSDPRVTYDQYAGRWIVMVIGYGSAGNPVGAYFVAVSDDSDPNGFWYKWKTNGTVFGSDFPDYPALGYDSSDAVYMTSNQFSLTGGGFLGTNLQILKKSEMYRTDSLAPALTFTNVTGIGGFTLRVAHTFGSIDGGGNFAVSSSSGGGSIIQLYRINNPVTSPSVPLRMNVNIGAYSVPPNATQPGGATPINTLDARISGDVYYRNGRIYFALCTGFNFGSGTVAAIRYVEMDTTGTVIHQNITYGADLENFFYPAPIPVNSGNVAMGYSHSSPASFVSGRYAGNFPADLTQGVLKAGVATYVQIDGAGRNRWGDYSGSAQDPVFPRRVWFFSNFASAVNAWSTWCGFTTLLNHKPDIANPTPIIMNEGETRVDTIPVTESDGEAIASFTALLKPAYATFVNIGGGRGVLTLSPSFTDSGTDTVKLRATDNAVPLAADTEFVEIVVNEKNAAPALSITPPDTVTVYECCSTCVSITASDADSGPFPLVIFAESLPSFATLTDSGGGKASLCLNNITSADIITLVNYIKATDGEDTTSVALTINVLPKGDLSGNGILTSADVVLELNCAFLGIPPPVSSNCDNCDFDGNGASASDVVLLLNATFLGIPLPAC